jgi:hypothetical protein
MKEFMLSPPPTVLYVAAGILGVAIVSLILKKGEPVRKAIGVGIAVVVVAAIVLYVYRPVTIRVGEERVEVRGAGGLALEWEDVESAVYVEDLRTSPFRPTVRTRGVAIGGYRTGRFLLSNGDAARVFMVQAEDAVIIQTDERTYVFAPENADEMAEAVDTYRVYEDEGGSE